MNSVLPSKRSHWPICVRHLGVFSLSVHALQSQEMCVWKRSNHYLVAILSNELPTCLNIKEKRPVAMAMATKWSNYQKVWNFNTEFVFCPWRFSNRSTGFLAPALTLFCSKCIHWSSVLPRTQEGTLSPHPATPRYIDQGRSITSDVLYINTSWTSLHQHVIPFVKLIANLLNVYNW